MHIALDIRTIQAHFAGDRIYLENLIRRLDRLPGVSRLSLYGDSRLGPEVAIEGCGKCQSHLFSASKGWLWTPLAVPQRLKRDGVNIFHAPYLVPPLSSCPRVVTIHDLAFRLLPEYYPQRRARLRSMLIELSAHRAQAVITDSESSRRDLLRVFRLAPGKVHVVPLAAPAHFLPGDTNEARQRVKELLGVEGPFVLTVGYSSPRKNVPRLIEAVAQLRQRGHEISMIVVGLPGTEDPSAIQRRYPALGERLVFTGWIDQDDLVALYRAASVFAFPSLYEGFGLPVLEAMACGTPVVTSTASSLPEVAGDAALLVEPEDVTAIAGALDEIIGNEDVAANLRARGLARAAQYSWDRTAQLTYEIYRNTLER